MTKKTLMKSLRLWVGNARQLLDNQLIAHRSVVEVRLQRQSCYVVQFKHDHHNKKLETKVEYVVKGLVRQCFLQNEAR